MLSADKLQGLDMLAGAVVAQAVRDYKRAYTLSLRCGKETNNLKELKRFFRSDWFVALADVDGERTMRLIEDSTTNKKRTNKVYAIKEVAGIIGCTRRSVKRYIQDGELKAAMVNGEWRITQAALDAFRGGISNA